MQCRRVVIGADAAEASGRESAAPAPEELLAAVVNGWRLSDVVPRTLDLVERDPLASGGRFPGDLVRGLMELPGSFWGRAPRLYARYRAALRATACARQQLPPESRLAFWGPLDDGAGARAGAP